MRHEWRFLHDVMAESMLGLVTYIQETLGDEDVAEAWEESLERGWKRDTDKIVERDRRKIVEALAATWRAHSTSGVGPDAGRLHDHGGRGEVHLRDEPLRQRSAALAQRRLQGEDPYGVTEKAHDWSYGREGFPLYCTHCSFMNELLPIRGTARRSTPRTRPRTSITIPAPGTGTRTPRTSRTSTGSATGSTRSRRVERHRGCALVTGAARGIGSAIAVQLAAEGWAVAACDRDASVSAPATAAMRSHSTSPMRTPWQPRSNRPSPRSGRSRRWWRTPRSSTTSHPRSGCRPRRGGASSTST